MGAVSLMKELIAGGVEFAIDGNHIRWRNSRGKMTPECVSVLRDNKVEVLQFLMSKTSGVLQIAEVTILDAIRAGNRRDGAVVTKTKLGVTRTYQLVEQLIADGQIHQAHDGLLSVVGTGYGHAKSNIKDHETE